MGIRFNQLHVGDTWSFTVDAGSDYPAGTWTLTLYLVPRFASPVVGPITLTSAPDSADGSLHRFSVAAAVTASYTAGMYSYYTTASDGSQRFTLDASEWSGEVELLADPSALAQGHDGRSTAARALDQARAAYADAVDRRAAVGAQAEVEEYEIGNRRMKYVNAQTAIDSLIAMIKHLEIEVARERRAEAIRRGLADPRHVYVRTYRA